MSPQQCNRGLSSFYIGAISGEDPSFWIWSGKIKTSTWSQWKVRNIPTTQWLRPPSRPFSRMMCISAPWFGSAPKCNGFFLGPYYTLSRGLIKTWPNPANKQTNTKTSGNHTVTLEAELIRSNPNAIVFDPDKTKALTLFSIWKFEPFIFLKY